MKYRPEEVKRKMDSMKKETVMCGKEDGDGVWAVGAEGVDVKMKI